MSTRKTTVHTVPPEQSGTNRGASLMIMGILFLLAAVGVFLAGRRTKNIYLYPAGVAFVVAGIASFFAPWWITLLTLGMTGGVGYGLARRHIAGRSNKPLFIGSSAIAAVVAIVLAVGAFLGTSAPPSHAAATNTPNQSVINDLTVKTTTYKCATDSNGLVQWKIGALATDRKWSDAISTPFASSDQNAMLAEAQQADCSDPLYGVQMANYFANLKIGSFSVASVNPWLNEFGGDGSKMISTKAASYMPLLNVTNPTNQQVNDAVAKNQAWQGVAAKLNTLLSKFTNNGVHTGTSILNYHLLGGGLVADQLPAVGLNDHQDGLPALVLTLTDKVQGCLLEMGLNTGDKRVEQFSCATPPVPVATPTTTPGTPTQPGTPTGTPPGGCKTGCITTTPTPTPSTTPTCQYYTSPKGTCYGPKAPAPQPSGVGNPHMTNPGTVNNTPPPAKPTPLKPTGGGGSTTAPGSTPVPSYSPPPPATGAPAPSQAPTTCVPAPGMTSC